MRKQRRRLSDLYIVGQNFTFDDGESDPVTVYIRKLNPVENETALRTANATRARLLVMRKDTTSAEYQSLYSQVYDMGDTDQLVEYLVTPELMKRRLVVEAELADEPEWKDENYLQGLRDSWTGGLAKRHAEDADDPEVKKVLAELEHFDEQVSKFLQGEDEALKRSFEALDLEELRQKVLEQMLDLEADMVWMNEYRRCEVWLAVRDADDHHARYFQSRDEVDELSLGMLNKVMEAYRSISVDISEGKDLEATDNSSPPPEPQKPQETDDSSGPKIVTR